MDYRKMKIEYVRYNVGTEAYQIAPKEPRRNTAARPKAHKAPPKKVQVKEICIDPLALIAICLTVVMVALMFVGFSRLQAAQAEQQQMEQYLQWLETEKQELTEYFDSGYNPEAVRKAALSLGMIPVEEVDHWDVPMDAPAVVLEAVPEVVPEVVPEAVPQQ